MTILPTNISSIVAPIEEISSYDEKGAIIYIIGVLAWYAIGFGLILIDDITPQPDWVKSNKHVSVYQTVYDLREQQAKNEILLELKDQNRRTKLWQIYYGISKTHPMIKQKDEEAIELIEKQLNDLNGRRRILRNSLQQISLDEPDEKELDHDESDSESFNSIQPINNNRSNEKLKSYFK